MEPQLLYGVLYLEINLMASLLVLFIRFKTLGISRMVSQRNFSSAIDAEIVFFLSDTAAVLITCGILPFGETGLIAAKTIYFFSTALMCFCWFVYFEHLQGSPFVKSRLNVLISSCLVWIMGVLLVINLFTGIFFYVKDGTYYRGSWFILQYVLAYVYVFGASGRALIGLLHERNLSKRRLLVSLALFPVAPAGAGIIQFIYPQMPVACVTLSLATMVLYQTSLDDMISIDPLTRLNNRKQLSFYYEQWQHREETTPLYLLLIDADKFKAINDTYGHIQGDAALERIADTLRKSCGKLFYRANIARYGGDEFVMLVRADDEAEIDGLKSRINQNLAEMNREADAPYDLTVSIGTARAEREEPLKAVIEKADKELYEEKRSPHRL